jgi:hypothetical protein
MQIVLGILHLNTPNGAASYVLTVASHLQRLGHDVTVFTTDAGMVADHARDRGLQVADDYEQLPHEPDAVLTNDTAIAYELAARRPAAPHVFVAHGAELDMALPPQAPGIVSAVIVMNARVQQRLAAMALNVEIVRLTQPIDFEHFTSRSPARDEPRTALLLGNYLRGAKLEMVVEACERAGLEWLQVGRDGVPVTDPHSAIADADIVIGYGRSILEAMACGRAAFIMDQYVGDGWVTPERYAALEADGFRGTAFATVSDVDSIERGLRAYAPTMGALNRDLILQNHSPFAHAERLARLFKRLNPNPHPNGRVADELARLVRAQWHADWNAQEFSRETALLRQRVEQAETRVAVLERDLDMLKKTRRYRFGAALARPLDRLRARSRRRRLEREAARAQVGAITGGRPNNRLTHSGR